MLVLRAKFATGGLQRIQVKFGRVPKVGEVLEFKGVLDPPIMGWRRAKLKRVDNSGVFHLIGRIRAAR